MTTVLMVMAVGAPIGLVWLAVVSFPDLMHTKYRHELWRIRDDVVDDLISGRITHGDAAKRLLRSLYGGIERAPQHTLRLGAMTFIIFRDMKDYPAEDSLEDFILGPNVDPAERERLAGYLKRYRDASVRHMLIGTPLAWVAQLVLVPTFALRRRQQSGLERAVEVEIAAPLIGNGNGDGSVSRGLQTLLHAC